MIHLYFQALKFRFLRVFGWLQERIGLYTIYKFFIQWVELPDVYKYIVRTVPCFGTYFVLVFPAPFYSPSRCRLSTDKMSFDDNKTYNDFDYFEW